MPRSRKRGFTLIELMIVITVIAVLAMIAYPLYTKQIRKGRRAEAKEAISTIALGEEKWRVNNPAYTTTVANTGGVSTTTNQYYTIAITRAGSGNCVNGTPKAGGNNFLITATAAGAQASDTDCATLRWNNDCGTVTKDSTPSGNTCW